MTIGNRILLYGATGYMGQLLAARAADLKLPVTLAARDAKKLAEVADRVGLPYVAFALETPLARAERLKGQAPTAPAQRPLSREARVNAALTKDPNQAVDKALANVAVLLNAAGPFAETAEPLARACMRTQTHYMDISGEYDVFSTLRTLYYEAGQPNVAVVPGVGLTVLGSDLLLRRALTDDMPRGMGDPYVVRVALSRVPCISRGSAKTMLESVRNGVRIRQNDDAVAVPVGGLVRSFSFGADGDFTTDEPRICTAMTLADARSVDDTVNSTREPAPKTRIRVPNIETYVEASSLEQLSYEIGGELALALRTYPLKASLDYALSFWPEGPAVDERLPSSQQVVVEVEDRYRRVIATRLSTPNSYDFTVAVALCAASLLSTRGLTGFLSPSRVVTTADLGRYLEAKSCQINITYRGCGAMPPRPSSFPPSPQ